MIALELLLIWGLGPLTILAVWPLSKRIGWLGNAVARSKAFHPIMILIGLFFPPAWWVIFILGALWPRSETSEPIERASNFPKSQGEADRSCSVGQCRFDPNKELKVKVTNGFGLGFGVAFGIMTAGVILIFVASVCGVRL